MRAVENVEIESKRMMMVWDFQWLLVIVITAFFQTSFAFASQVLDGEVADDNGVAAPIETKITDVNFVGSGCSQDTARHTISPDFNEASILFDKFSAEIGQGSENSGKKRDQKSCRITVNMEIPDGWQVGVVGAQFRGFAFVSENAYGYLDLKYKKPKKKKYKRLSTTYFQPSAGGEPYSDNFTVDESFPSQMITPCSKNGKVQLTLYTSVGVQLRKKKGPKDFSQVVLDSADAAITMPLQYKRCKK